MTIHHADPQETLASIARQARFLAQENRRADASICKVFWFPNDHEVRLVEFDDTIPASQDGEIHPYYFRPSEEDGLPSPSAIALIRPGEERRLKLPENWGHWDAAVEL